MFDGILTADEGYGLCCPDSRGNDDEVLALLTVGRARVARAWVQLNYVGPRTARWRFGWLWPQRVWEVPVCAAGALGIIGIGDLFVWNSPAQEEAVALLARSLPRFDPAFVSDRLGLVIGWNDADGRTQAQVVVLFDRAIALRQAQLVAAKV